MFLPHKAALTTELNGSSNNIKSTAFFARSVPDIHIDMPTLAALRAGTLFVPSPVIATTFIFPKIENSHLV